MQLKSLKTSLNSVPEESVDDPEPFTDASTRSNATKVIKKSLNLVDEDVDNKDGLPSIIVFTNVHNHTLTSGEALSFLRPTDDVRWMFNQYFNSGLGISESIKIHEEKIELKYGINSTELANAHINPKYRTVRYWYDEWKKIHLGPHNGDGVLQILGIFKRELKMPGCAAINCSNSATKGFLMKHFPKDKVRRKLWLIKMKRDNWSPTNYSCLCEVHFREDMWEKTREDGSRRLKNDAVPTIFSFTKEKTKRKPPAHRQVTSIINNQVSKPEEKLKTSNQPTQDNDDDVSFVNYLESNDSENQNKMKHPVLALSKLKPEMYESSITFLKGFIDIMMDIEVGYKRTWKPSQKGSILATSSILDIQKIYLDDKGFNFILTSRFTQDCLENVFSIMRTKNIVPNALQVKNNLKLLSVSQYLKDISKGSYNED
ncbi:hypothetical protein ACI65C_013805 [Semiaphis heraclei]